MLRRLAGILRRGLFVIGVIALIWTAVSLFVAFEAATTHTEVWSGSGSVRTIHVYGENLPQRRLFTPRIGQGTMWGPSPSGFFLPRIDHSTSRGYGYLDVTLPLLPIAFLCLVWPVTSYFIHRRRRNARGFEVVAERRNAEG